MDRNAIGAVCEYALAKHYGKAVLADWCETKSFSLEHRLIPCDVGKNLHVRGTPKANGRLIAHPYDPDSGIFVLARTGSLVVNFIGWTYGRQAKYDEHWCDTGPGFSLRPAFVFPSDELQPMETIPQEAIWCYPTN